MRRAVLAMLGVLLVVGAPPLTAAAVPVMPAALALPPGFSLVDYPTGQAPYNLTNFAWLPGGGLLTTGKDGTITVVPPGGSPRVLATVPGVRAVADHGLLGLAPANDYATSGRVYLSYDKGQWDKTGVGMVEEWTATPPEAPTTFTRTRTVLDGATASPPLAQDTNLHGIDSVVVAPDDTLFVSVGDDSLNDGDPRTLRAQDLSQPYGKLLRLTPSGAGVPSNPHYSAASPASWRSRVYASGFRNPFRFDLDPRTGLPYLGDVGWATDEEVDALEPGANAGWPCYEGLKPTSFAGEPVCQALYDSGSAMMPIWTYDHRVGGRPSQASVVGGTFYTGTSYPAQYRGSFFFGDYSRRTIWSMATDTARRVTRAPEPGGFATDIGAPVAFHPGPNGDVTFADLLTGTVRRLVHTDGNRAPVARFTADVDPLAHTVTLSAEDSYDLDGDPLVLEWDLGDGNSATGRDVTHRYAAHDPVAVRLTVRDALGAEDVTTLTVHPGNHTPDLVLDAPVSRTYRVGDRVVLSATGTDPEDGALPVRWEVALKHCAEDGGCHLHPDGTRQGRTLDERFTDHGADTSMLVTATVEDGTGAAVRRTYEARPRLRRVSVESSVPVHINGHVASSALVVARSQVRLVAPASSSYWTFRGWSDGGTRARTFVMPDADHAVTARYDSAIDTKYAAVGGATGRLRAPTSAEYAVAGGRARNYESGRIYWSPATGAHDVRGGILGRYLEIAGPASSLGFPRTDELAVRGGRASYFRGGRIYWSARTRAQLVRGPVLRRYLEAGGPSRYGLPRTPPSSVPGGLFAHFTGNRSIFWTRSEGAHLVHGPVRTQYFAMGYQASCLGFPVSDPYRVRINTKARFENGYIVHLTRLGETRARC